MFEPSKKHKSRVWADERKWLVLIEAAPHWADFSLVEVVGWGSDGTLYFENAEGQPDELDPEKAEPVLTGFVKWDGCTEAHMSGNHMCDAAASALAFGKVWAWAINQCHPAMIAAAKAEGKEAHLLWEPAPL